MGVHSRCSEVHHGGHPQGIRCRAPSVCAPLEKISEGKSKRCVLAAPRSEPKQTPKNTAEKTNQTNCSVLQPPISSLAENREESNAQPRVAWRDVCVCLCACVCLLHARHTCATHHTSTTPTDCRPCAVAYKRRAHEHDRGKTALRRSLRETG